MAVHYLEKSDSAITECGRDAHKIMSAVIGGNADGVDCYYCLNKLSKRGIRFSPPTPIMHAKNCTCIICIAIGARDKEWVAWAESQCTEHIVYGPFDCQYHSWQGWTFFWSHRRNCFECWQSRRKEIGI